MTDPQTPATERPGDWSVEEAEAAQERERPQTPATALREALEFIADWAHDCSPSNSAFPWEHADSFPDPKVYGFDDIEDRALAALAAEPPALDVDGVHIHLPEGFTAGEAKEVINAALTHRAREKAKR